MSDVGAAARRRELIDEMEAARRPASTREERDEAVEMERQLMEERLRKYPSGLCRCDCTRDAVRAAAEICEREALNSPSAADALESVAARIRELAVGPIS